MSAYKSFALFGAGSLGLKLVQALAAQSVSLLVVFRAGGSFPSMPDGVKSVTVDYSDVKAISATLRTHAVEVVVSVVGSSVGASGVGDVISWQTVLADSAKEAGAKLFVPSEFSLPVVEQIDDGVMGSKARVIEHLQSIDMPYALFYTGFFAEYAPWFLGAAENKKFYILGKGNTPISFTSTSDIVGFAAHVLATLPPSELANRTFRIEGTRTTMTGVTTLYTDGKALPVEHVDKIPSDVPNHEFLMYLQLKAESGAADVLLEKIGGGKVELSNSLWKGHKWTGLKEALGL